MIQQQEALAFLSQHKSDIEKQFFVTKLGIFGSVARNEAQQHSDLDVLVEFEPKAKTFDNFMHLAFFLEEVLNRRVEVVTPEALSPYIGPHILKEVEYVIFGD